MLGADEADSKAKIFITVLLTASPANIYTKLTHEKAMNYNAKMWLSILLWNADKWKQALEEYIQMFARR